VNVYAFHIEVPSGVGAVEIEAQYLSPTASSQGRIVATDAMANLQWNNMMLYPAGYAATGIPVALTLTLPNGWSYASALSPQTGTADGRPITFAVTDFETLVDSPMFAGAHFKSYDLDPGAKIPVMLNVVADEAKLIAPTDKQLEAHRKLIDETYALFGSQHFERYDFLLALSDEMGRIGLEHHRSSENNPGRKYFTDQESSLGDWDLLAHELVHSWNGKFRRPADLWTSNYDVPMRNSLLWVYEGQTTYWGEVLAARAGMWTKEQALDSLALNAALYDERPGGRWRPLVDTTNDPIVSARNPQPWRSWQRSEDYYVEGLLVWLDADTLIRERSRGRRSLDDFAELFFGVEPGRVKPVTYTFEDVVAALNAVEPYDWAGFLTERLTAINEGAPIDGLARGGWRLVFSDAPNALIKAADKRNKTANFLFSVGFIVGESGRLSEVLWDGPAFKESVVVGDQIVAVNGRAYEAEKLADAIKAAQDGTPIELLIKSDDRYRTVRLDYRGGLRYPHLERIKGTPDLLSRLFAPKTR
jgi:predicted metalloprotease with PDZ domain